jgi:putative Holliday junction resolvase
MPRILGLDYGERRLGFAVSDELEMLATPLAVEQCASDPEAAAIVRRVCERMGASRLVIGLPLNMDGSKGPQAHRVERFAETLRALLNIPVVLWDERLSTRAAERAMREGGVKAREQRGRVDKIAAQLMLQCYLDAQSARGVGDEHEVPG